MVIDGGPVRWRIDRGTGFNAVAFEIAAKDGILKPDDLTSIRLPDELSDHRSQGLVIGGRGPVWLYAYLTHLAHPFAWVGILDPRIGAVVVERHVADAPALGAVVPIDPPSRPAGDPS